MLIQSYTAVPLYEARTRILIEDERSTAIPGLNADNQYYEDPEPYYQTQYRILTGRDLIRRVVKKLEVEKVPEFNGMADAPDTPLNVARGLARERSRFSAAATARRSSRLGPTKPSPSRPTSTRSRRG